MIVALDAAYLASMFDHGGGVFISKSLNKTPANYRLDVVFTNQNPKAFYEFRDKLNYLGSIRPDGNSWRWIISTTSAFDLLVPIRPYIKLKNEQIELAMRFLNTVDQTPGYKKKLKPEVLEKREYCYQQMKLMKLKYAKGGTND